MSEQLPHSGADPLPATVVCKYCAEDIDLKKDDDFAGWQDFDQLIYMHDECLYESDPSDRTYRVVHPPGRELYTKLVSVLLDDGSREDAYIDPLLSPELEDGEMTYTVEWIDKARVANGLEKKKHSQLQQYMCMAASGDPYQVDYPYESITEYMRRHDELPALDMFICRYDNLINSDIKQLINKLVDEMNSGSYKDYHPNSSNMVLDVVHPSMYCYVKDASPLVQKEDLVLPRAQAGHFYRGSVCLFGRPFETSKFQWMPAEVEVDDQGSARFTSYINGLGHRLFHPQLYLALEHVLSSLVPKFEESLLKLKSRVEEEHGTDSLFSDFASLNNSNIQVVCKIADYILQPGEQYTGVWHVEGMSHEAIVATGIYYAHTDPGMVEKGLEVRTTLSESYEEMLTEEYTHEEPPPFPYDSSALELGIVDTPADSCVVFTNDVQHKLVQLHNPTSEVVRRRIVVFFLVNPLVRIVSSRHVPDQDQARRRLFLNLMMDKCEQRDAALVIANDVRVRIFAALTQIEGFTLAQAHEHRLKLMQERSFFKNRMNEEFEREVGLCEH